MPVALYTFGLFARPAADPANARFHALNDPVFARVDAAPGLIGRSGYADEPGPAPWGAMVWPDQAAEAVAEAVARDGWAPATLSLWADLEAPAAFAYHGLHARAMAETGGLFREGAWAAHALWWSETRPDWAEAVRRHARLGAEGPTPQAFSFARPFDPEGRPTRLDTARLKTYAAA